MASPALSLSGFGVAFGANVVLADVTLCVPRVGVSLVVGPVGSGKSTLLRTLAGLNDAQPAMRTWGQCEISTQGGVRLVAQDSRFLTSSVRENLSAALPERAALTRPRQTEVICAALVSAGLPKLVAKLDTDVLELATVEQRKLAMLRAVLARPGVLCLDEPTAGLEPAYADEVADLIVYYARTIAVLVVTHNQRIACRLGGRVTLVAGGRVQEKGATRSFYAAPRSVWGREYVRTGSCRVPGPACDRASLATDAPPPPPLPETAREAMRCARGPRGFYWLTPGLLGGLPRPGIVDELEHDLRGLQELGIRWLFTLEKVATVPESALLRAGVRNEVVPIEDMGVPSLDGMFELCQRLRELMGRGEACAVHCLAGLGRTGTVLACVLIAQGEDAPSALLRVRELKPRSVQSQAQLEFLRSFETFVRARGPALPWLRSASTAPM